MTTPGREAGKPSLVSLFLRSAVFWILAPGSVFVLVPVLILRASDVRWTVARTASEATGVALIAAGTAVMLWCAVDFVLRGWGTAAPYDPPRRLVTGRLYTRVRNPMYLGGEAILLGESLAIGSPGLLVWAVAMAALWHLAVVFVEEPGLRRRFGPDYEAYTGRVPRSRASVAPSCPVARHSSDCHAA